MQIDFGNNLMVEYKCLKKQGEINKVLFQNKMSMTNILGGEYKYLPYSISKQPFCDYTKDDKFFYPDMAKDSDLPDQSELECPTGQKKVR